MAENPTPGRRVSDHVNGLAEQLEALEASTRRLTISTRIRDAAAVLTMVLLVVLAVIMYTEFRDHRIRDRVHICTAAIDHWTGNKALRNLGQQAGYDVGAIPAEIDPDAREVCEQVQIEIPTDAAR